MGRGVRRAGPYRVADDEEDEWGVVSHRATVIDAQLARLSADGRVRAAALVGYTFKLDPVMILEESDSLRALVRLAAHNYLQTEREKAARKK